MDELSIRRKRLFSSAKFSSALFYNGDATRGAGASFHYFSGCDVDGSYLFLKKSGGILFTNSMNLREAKEVSPYPVRVLGKEAAKELRRACGRGKAAFSSYEMNATKYLALKKKAHLNLADETEKIQSVRGEKSASEKLALAKSASIARKILADLDPWKYKTEAEVSSALKIAALSAGAVHSFEPIVATGKNSAQPHHKSGSTKLGDFVLVDFGVIYKHYCSDLTRCYFRKKGMEEEKAYEKCKSVFAGLKKELPHIKNSGDLSKYSDYLIERFGLPKMIHSIGHGIGLEVHECQHLNAKAKDSLQNCVLAIEPAAYFPKFGVRYEEMLVNKNGKWAKL